MKKEYEKWIAKIRKTIDSNKDKLKGKKCAIFGMSDPNREAVLYLRKLGICVNLVLDNNLQRIGSEWLGIDVVHPSYLREHFDSDLVVVICGGEFIEKSSQIFSYGYSDDNMLVIIPDGRSEIAIIREIVSDWRAYKKLCNQYRGKKLLLIPLTATGDAYLTGMYLESYLESSGIENYQILVASKGVERILGLFSFHGVTVIGKETMELLQRLVSRFGEKMLNVCYLMIWGLFGQDMINIEEYTNISFRDVLIKGIFNIVPQERLKNPVFRDISENYEQLGFIKKGRTVLLSPYASTYDRELSLEWWEELVTVFKQNGYCVFTNSAGDGEPVIKGSHPCAWEYEEIVPYLNYCGLFVGVRSGLCEIISSSSCKKIIIYQEYMSDKLMKFFSLVNMGLSEADNILELKNAFGKEKELKSRVLEFAGI